MKKEIRTLKTKLNSLRIDQEYYIKNNDDTSLLEVCMKIKGIEYAISILNEDTVSEANLLIDFAYFYTQNKSKYLMPEEYMNMVRDFKSINRDER